MYACIYFRIFVKYGKADCEVYLQLTYRLCTLVPLEATHAFVKTHSVFAATRELVLLVVWHLTIRPTWILTVGAPHSFGRLASKFAGPVVL
jgi:hypothetical protein